MEKFTLEFKRIFKYFFFSFANGAVLARVTDLLIHARYVECMHLQFLATAIYRLLVTPWKCFTLNINKGYKGMTETVTDFPFNYIYM